MEAKAGSTKQKLLDISRKMMMSKGYNATTVEEICKTASVTKGAFFHYFKTKEDLGMSVLRDYWHVRQRQFAESDWMTETTALQQLQGFLATVADIFMHDPDGFSCLAGSFTQELADTNPMFREQVAELFAEWTEQIKPVLLEAQKHAQSQHTIDIELLADHIVTVIEGALILAQARQNPAIIAQQMNILSFNLQLLFSP